MMLPLCHMGWNPRFAFWGTAVPFVLMYPRAIKAIHYMLCFLFLTDLEINAHKIVRPDQFMSTTSKTTRRK